MTNHETLESTTISTATSTSTSTPTIASETPVPTLDVILNRSFEAMWYQAEVLHKREMDLIEKKIKALDERIDALEKNIKDGIHSFAKVIMEGVIEALALHHQVESGLDDENTTNPIFECGETCDI